MERDKNEKYITKSKWKFVILCSTDSDIIPTPHHYAYFMQFDLLEKKFYTSINSMSRNLGTIFLPLTPKMYNNVDKNTTWWQSWKYKEWIIIFVEFIDA